MLTNVLEYLEQTVSRHPNKVAFTNGETGLSFSQVYAQSRAIGTCMQKEGFYKKPIAVFMKKHPKTIVAFLGVIYSGCYYVPIDAEMPRHRIEQIFRDLQPVAMICDDTTASLANEIDHSGNTYLYDRICGTKADDAALAAIRNGQIDTDPIYVVYTSGSTGSPKGVMACHRSVLDYIEQLSALLRFSENTVFGNQAPLYLDACLKEIYPTLKHGATTYLVPRQLYMFPIQLVDFLNQYKINTVCWVVSALTMLSAFKTFDRIKPEYLHTVAFSGEVFPVRQLHLWITALPNARFINLYGPTEVTGVCCYYEVDREFSPDERLPIGRPFRNTAIVLLDEHDKEPAPGEQGEICVRGTCLSLGYYRDPQKTKEVFVQNPLNDIYPEQIYRTGDLGKYNERGELVFLSRKDFQIKSMGHRIELGEIEAIANTHPSVYASCCIFDADTKKIILYYVGNGKKRDMTGYMQNMLPRYMQPNVIRQLPRMPLTPNGKMDRNLLRQLYEQENN